MIYLCKQKQEHKGGPGATGPAAGAAGVLTYRRRSPDGRGLKAAKGAARARARECHPHNAKHNRLNAKEILIALHPVPRPAQQDRDLRRAPILTQKIS